MSVIYCEGCHRIIDTDFEETYELPNGQVMCVNCVAELETLCHEDSDCEGCPYLNEDTLGCLKEVT